uniref:DUF281 domain-containing protein n=1 Tax=Caenorhabditis tropicalis TaxID=1561998 RepID=A0A1I7UGA3_9PELO
MFHPTLLLPVLIGCSLASFISPQYVNSYAYYGGDTDGSGAIPDGAIPTISTTTANGKVVVTNCAVCRLCCIGRNVTYTILTIPSGVDPQTPYNQEGYAVPPQGSYPVYPPGPYAPVPPGPPVPPAPPAPSPPGPAPPAPAPPAPAPPAPAPPGPAPPGPAPPAPAPPSPPGPYPPGPYPPGPYPPGPYPPGPYPQEPYYPTAPEQYATPPTSTTPTTTTTIPTTTTPAPVQPCVPTTTTTQSPVTTPCPYVPLPSEPYYPPQTEGPSTPPTVENSYPTPGYATSPSYVFPGPTTTTIPVPPGSVTECCTIDLRTLQATVSCGIEGASGCCSQSCSPANTVQRAVSINWQLLARFFGNVGSQIKCTDAVRLGLVNESEIRGVCPPTYLTPAPTTEGPTKSPEVPPNGDAYVVPSSVASISTIFTAIIAFVLCL